MAREVFPDTWREEMETVRRVAFQLVQEGRLKVLQRGATVDPLRVKGPIRLQIVK